MNRKVYTWWYIRLINLDIDDLNEGGYNIEVGLEHAFMLDDILNLRNKDPAHPYCFSNMLVQR